MSKVNFYKVLNVSPDCSLTDIKKSYRKLVIKFHPDKCNGDDRVFELITEAYTVLSNKKMRAQYDKYYNELNHVGSNHSDLREKYKAYDIASKTDVTLVSEEDSIKLFKKEFEVMDKKRNIVRNSNGPMTEADLDNCLQDLQLTREQTDIETTHDRLFDDGRFDSDKFNKAYDMIHKKTNDELIKHTGNPMAWNVSKYDYAPIGSTEMDSNVEFDDSDFAPTLKHTKHETITKEDIENLEAVDYTKDHKADRDTDYKVKLNDRMNKYKTQTDVFNQRTKKDYKHDDYGDYGIFDQLDEGIKGITWDISDDLEKKYRRLMDMRKDK